MHASTCICMKLTFENLFICLKKTSIKATSDIDIDIYDAEPLRFHVNFSFVNFFVSRLSLTQYNCYCISIIWSIKQILNEAYGMRKAKSQCIFHVFLSSDRFFIRFLFWGYYSAVVTCRINILMLFSSPRCRDETSHCDAVWTFATPSPGVLLRRELIVFCFKLFIHLYFIFLKDVLNPLNIKNTLRDNEPSKTKFMVSIEASHK